MQAANSSGLVAYFSNTLECHFVCTFLLQCVLESMFHLQMVHFNVCITYAVIYTHIIMLLFLLQILLNLYTYVCNWNVMYVLTVTP